jgi:hypothetical protein
MPFRFLHRDRRGKGSLYQGLYPHKASLFDIGVSRIHSNVHAIHVPWICIGSVVECEWQRHGNVTGNVIHKASQPVWGGWGGQYEIGEQPCNAMIVDAADQAALNLGRQWIVDIICDR